MVRSYTNFVFLAFSLFVSLPSSHAQLLVNDYSGTVSGNGFTDTFTTYYATSSPIANPTATGNAGQVDVGFYTVNFQDAPDFSFGGSDSIINGYLGDMGSRNRSTGFYEGGTYLDLAGVTTFLVSMRKQTLNTAKIVNFYILTNRDTEIYIPFDISGLSSTTFADVSIDLAGSSAYNYIPGLKAVQIGIKGDGNYDTSAGQATYNFSVDSLRSVPEPSTGVLLATAIGALALAHRRRG